MDERAEALLALVGGEEGLSAARACKRLGLSRSELQRLLTRLGPETSIGGLDLVRVEDEDGRETLWLARSARGRCSENGVPQPAADPATAMREAVAHAADAAGESRAADVAQFAAERSGAIDQPPDRTDASRFARASGAAREPLARVDALRFTAGGSASVSEALAEETPVALLYNGVPHVVMMATPADLEDFAVGFSLTEGIVADAADIDVVDVLERERGLAVHLAIPPACFEALRERRRALVGRTGCGLCGAEALDGAVRPVRSVDMPLRVSREALSAAFARLAASQPLNRDCGALHAAAAIVGDGLLVREDVGRHNALDKVVGALARDAAQADALLVTSRASYELVHKCAQAGVPLLAAVSAPTAYAVRLACEAGLTLVAFAREERMTVYAGELPATLS